jgi:hypothetical protein
MQHLAHFISSQSRVWTLESRAAQPVLVAARKRYQLMPSTAQTFMREHEHEYGFQCLPNRWTPIQRNHSYLDALKDPFFTAFQRRETIGKE